MIDRIVGVYKLDVNTFEEVEADESATTQAAIIVGIVALMAGISAFAAANFANSLMDSFSQFGDSSEFPFADLMAQAQISPFGALLNAFIGVFVAWIVAAAVTFFVGTSIFNGTATMGEMLRVIGFAQAPRFLVLLGFIPCLGPLIVFASWIWTIAATFVGIRQGLDLDNGKTLGTVLIAVVVVWILNWIISLLFNAVF